MTCDGRGGKGKKSISVEEFEKLVMESIGWKLCFSTTKTKNKKTNKPRKSELGSHQEI